MKARKVIIADPSSHFRTGFRNILQNIGNVEIMGEAASCEELLWLLEHTATDLVFIDLNLPFGGAREASCDILKKFPGVEMIVISEFDNYRYVRLMYEAGTRGFLSKNHNNLDHLQKILKKKTGHFITSVEGVELAELIETNI
jgi:DNA-binding NarL/FixJ family response regulator